ncbi:MAG: serine/threonine-protein kinase [Archangium sp.]
MRERLGNYELISLMSSGGMAELYLAVAMREGAQFRKAVAMKRMLPDARTDPDAVARFLDEARLTVSLDHRCIAQVFDLGEDAGELYLAMEFVVGADLDRIARRGAVPPGFVLYIAHQVATALSYAYDEIDPLSGQPRCVVHRDLTPRNVMVTFDGEVKVIDFGLAHFRGRVARTSQGQVRGTPQYMSPEQLRGEKLDSRTDLYALGVILWELLSGKELVAGERKSVLERFAQGVGAPPVITVAPETPAPLARIVDTLLDPRPAARIQSARELVRALSEIRYERFDAERAATLLRVRMPQTKEILKSVVAMAGDPSFDEAALDARIKDLRRADRTKEPAPGEVSVPAAVGPPMKAPPLGRIGAIIGAIGVLSGGAFIFSQREAKPVPVSAELPYPSAVTTAQQAVFLEANGDLLRALEVVDACRTPTGPCPGLESVRASIVQKLDASPCGSDAAAKKWIASAAARNTLEERLHLLDACRAGRLLHPLAAKEIESLTP